MPNDNTHTGIEERLRSEWRSGKHGGLRIFDRETWVRLDDVIRFSASDTRTPADPKAGDWDKELEEKSWAPSAGAQSRAVWLSVAKDILRRALSSAAPRITDVTSLQRYRLGLRVVDGIAEAPILEEDPNGSLVAFNHVLGLVAPATLSGITETDLDRVFEDVVSQYPLSSDRNVANEMHQQLVALLRQQPPFTPTQTEE